MGRSRRTFLGMIGGSLLGCANIEQRPLESELGADPRLDEAEKRLARARSTILAGVATRESWLAARAASRVIFSATSDPSRAIEIHDSALELFFRSSGPARERFGTDWRSRLAERGIEFESRGESLPTHPDRSQRVDLASEHRVLPLRRRATRPGLGVPALATRKRSADDPDRFEGDGWSLSPRSARPITLILVDRDASDRAPELFAVDPRNHDRIEAASGPIPVASDLSPGVAFALDPIRTPLRERIAALDPDNLSWTSGLHGLEPHRPGAIPVVFVHGYGSDATCWLQTINELQCDDMIARRYQFLVFVYPSINPFLHSAALLRKAIRERFERLDPMGRDRALESLVVVGHSLGGLLAKTAVRSSGDALWSLISPRPLEELAVDPAGRESIRESAFFDPDPRIRRMIYVCTPHHGTHLSSRLVGRLSGRLTPHPGPLAEAYRSLRESNRPEFFTESFANDGPSISIDQFEVGEPVLEALASLAKPPSVREHSIIARKRLGAIEFTSDGIVEYESAHLESAETERVVAHHHFAQDAPETIAELAAILHRHLSEFDAEA
ncbi:MAG: alpha/beta fold hydrolase [Isosphaeraceae bacterium]|nr:alpha/beta fold hydrolase [Isosphaeraceae bacterium]